VTRPTRARASLAAECAARRRAGQTLNAIADALGLSPTQAHRLAAEGGYHRAVWPLVTCRIRADGAAVVARRMAPRQVA